MILRPRVLLIVIATGLFWLAALLGPLLTLAGWRLGNGSLLLVGLGTCAFCGVVYWWHRLNAHRLRAWANDHD